MFPMPTILSRRDLRNRKKSLRRPKDFTLSRIYVIQASRTLKQIRICKSLGQTIRHGMIRIVKYPSRVKKISNNVFLSLFIRLHCARKNTISAIGKKKEESIFLEKNRMIFWETSMFGKQRDIFKLDYARNYLRDI